MKLHELKTVQGQEKVHTFTPPQTRLLQKFDITIGTEGVLVNPFSGVNVHLSAEAKALVSWVLDTYNAGLVGTLVTVRDWDRMKYLVCEIWPNAYFDLID